MHKLKRQSINESHIILITAITVIGIVFIVYYQIHQSYKQTWESTKTVNNNILITVTNTLENTFKTAQLSLEDTKAKLNQIKNQNIDNKWLAENLFHSLELYHTFGAEVILDSQGIILDTSSIALKKGDDFSDKDYFYTHKDNNDAGLFFGKPFYSKLENAPSMPLSVRYNNPDGSFGGVIVRTLKINEINDLFLNIELGESSGLNLILNNGTPIILFPFDETVFERSFVNNKNFQKMLIEKSGDFSSVSPIDGKDRFYTFVSLEDYPFVVSVVQSTKAITKKWLSAAIWASTLTILMLIIIVGLVYLMYKQVQINKQAALRIDSEKESFKTTLEAIKDAVMVIDKYGQVIYLNPSAENIIGATLRDSKGKLFSDLFSIFDEQRNQIVKITNIHKAIKNHRFISATDNRILINNKGDKYPIEISVSPLFIGDSLSSIVAVLHDVSNKRRQVNKMKYLAQHDSLTGLPNRRYLASIGEEALAYADSNDTLVGMLFMDLDGFKNANDTLGHSGGDEILIQVTKRFKSLLRNEDTLVRNGGDEFIVLVSKLHKEEELIMLAERLIKSTQKAFEIFGRKVHITTSVGISIYPKNATNLPDLIEYADQAMYMAKDKGRNCYCTYGKSKKPLS